MAEVIRIEHLSFKYPDGRQALRDVNLVVSHGQKVAIIGPNGAGKSTLLLHLNGILHSNGAIRLFGMTTESKNIKTIRNRVGLIFQDPDDQLFSPTVFDDVAFGPINMGLPKDEVQRRVAKALSQVGMSGYESRSSHHLSRGEKKRIAIATVLSMDPEVLVIDEPTSDLDPRSKWSLVALLKGLSMTQVITTHDLEILKALCERTVVLDEGTIVADGPTDEILSNVALLEAHGLAAPSRA
ncbi:MAG: energy-coupling factor ABC transporter ATP-binding protein [Dehalococcoidia bacterium]|nr:energy-coupling factor ABC transporter ATP-binding protein [Dehalococcoidia bacterium]